MKLKLKTKKIIEKDCIDIVEDKKIGKGGGNSGAVYVHKRYIGKKVIIGILEEKKKL